MCLLSGCKQPGEVHLQPQPRHSAEAYGAAAKPAPDSLTHPHFLGSVESRVYAGKSSDDAVKSSTGSTAFSVLAVRPLRPVTV